MELEIGYRSWVFKENLCDSGINVGVNIKWYLKPWNFMNSPWNEWLIEKRKSRTESEVLSSRGEAEKMTKEIEKNPVK